MRITDAAYETSIASKKILSSDIPEIAVAGRSNVGKSSFINMLTGRKKLARSSAEPGRTRMLNYFKINKGEFYIVDLPGYGFARVTDKEKDAWKEIIEHYFMHSEALKHVFLIVDIRHEPGDQDKQLAAYLSYYNIPYTILATKADKLSRMNRGKAAEVIRAAFPDVKDDILIVSAQDGTGKDAVLERISSILKA